MSFIPLAHISIFRADFLTTPGLRKTSQIRKYGKCFAFGPSNPTRYIEETV